MARSIRARFRVRIRCRRLILAPLLLGALVACDGLHRSVGPTLTFVLGRLADAGVADCNLAEWTAPWGKSYRICMDPSTAVEVTRRDFYGLRIEDRKYGDQTWYVVSARFASRFVEPLWKTLSSDDAVYAVLANGNVSAVLPGIEIGEHHPLLAATRDLAQAEAFAAQWDAPVDRMISKELAEHAIIVSLVQLIAAPERWAGKRVTVQGYLGHERFGIPRTLFLSREHAEADDFASAASLQYASDEEVHAALDCMSHPVQIVAVVDRDRGGWPELTRIEGLRAVPDGPDCIPVKPISRP